MYAAFYGLRAKPFQLNPDPDFFFGSRGHRRAMAYLEYGLHQGEGFIVITGEVGAGKTTLLRSLLRRLPGEGIEAAQIVSTQVGPDDLLRLVAASFGLDGQGLEKSTLLQRLEAHLRAMNAGGRRALLIVDEAQNLAPSAVEELRMLSNFQEGTRSLLQSFLVGQPEFREIMQRPGMRQLRRRRSPSQVGKERSSFRSRHSYQCRKSVAPGESRPSKCPHSPPFASMCTQPPSRTTLLCRSSRALYPAQRC